MIEPYYNEDGITIYNADTLAVMRALPDNSIDLIATDPPYFKVKGEAWDRQWDNPQKFLAWIGQLCDEWQRLLKPNGSLYCFASPKMAARVEATIAERFNVLNHIVWRKEFSRANQAEKEALRGFFGSSERITFAEHYGSDNTANGLSGYGEKCDEAARDIFGQYIKQIRQVHKISAKALTEVIGAYGNINHGGACSNWEQGYNVPTKAHYLKIQENWPGYFTREYEDLRREYEDLRGEYEDLRRPFNVTADVPYTDVWDFPTVQAFKAKHVCEKPIALMRHILQCSGKPGLTVFDGFIGSGTTLRAAKDLQMKAIGCDLSARDCETAANRLRQQAFDFEASE